MDQSIHYLPEILLYSSDLQGEKQTVQMAPLGLYNTLLWNLFRKEERIVMVELSLLQPVLLSALD